MSKPDPGLQDILFFFFFPFILIHCRLITLHPGHSYGSKSKLANPGSPATQPDQINNEGGQVEPRCSGTR